MQSRHQLINRSVLLIIAISLYACGGGGTQGSQATSSEAILSSSAVSSPASSAPPHSSSALASIGSSSSAPSLSSSASSQLTSQAMSSHSIALSSVSSYSSSSIAVVVSSSASSLSSSSTPDTAGDAARGAVLYHSYLVPKEEYPFTCATCHGDKNGGGTNRRIRPTLASYGNNQRNLEDYIAYEMPQISTHLCVEQCARDVAAYIRSWETSATPGVLFTDNFEDTPVDNQPAGWGNFVGWQANNTGNAKEWGNYALVDETDAYTGKRAAHFKTNNGSPALLVRPLPTGLQRVYLRAYVKMNVQLGNRVGIDNHEHIMGLKASAVSAGGDIGVGQVKGNLGTFYAPTDTFTLAAANPGLKVLQPNTWYCIETAFIGAKSYNQLFMRVNGNVAHSITTNQDWASNSMGNAWLEDKFNFVMFGFHGFSSRDAEVWMDDIVVSVDPIGCQ